MMEPVEEGMAHTFSLEVMKISDVETKIDVVQSILSSFRAVNLNRFNIRTFFENGDHHLKSLLTIVSFSNESIYLHLDKDNRSWGFRNGSYFISCFLLLWILQYWI